MQHCSVLLFDPAGFVDQRESTKASQHDYVDAEMRERGTAGRGALLADTEREGPLLFFYFIADDV